MRLLLAGVGGQGVLSAARWLGEAAMQSGEDVRVGQLHGMSQRGGSVQANVIIGAGFSSFIADGGADAVVAFEPLELARAKPKMAAGTRALVSTARIVPLPLAMAGKAYPDLDRLLAPVRALAAEIVTLDAAKLAERAGSMRALNIVMLGAMSGMGLLPFEDEALLGAIEGSSRTGPAPTRMAFAMGKEAVQA